MKIVRISLAVVWIIINLFVLGFLMFRQEKTGLCAEIYPPVCYNITNYGWPEPWLSMRENTKSTVNGDNARRIALVGLAFFVPSLLVAFVAGKGLRSENSRN